MVRWREGHEIALMWAWREIGHRHPYATIFGSLVMSVSVPVLTVGAVWLFLPHWVLWAAAGAVAAMVLCVVGVRVARAVRAGFADADAEEEDPGERRCATYQLRHRSGRWAYAGKAFDPWGRIRRHALAAERDPAHWYNEVVGRPQIRWHINEQAALEAEDAMIHDPDDPPLFNDKRRRPRANRLRAVNG